MVAPVSRKTGRRPRAETAELIRRSAVRLLRERGLQGFSNSVRLDDALALLEQTEGIRLTHGSVYGRIWVDQRDFQLDVVATAIGDYDGAEIAAAMVTPRPDDLPSADGSSPNDGHPGGAPADAVAAAMARAVAAARSSRQWNLWLGARTAVVSTPERDDDERLGSALAGARRQVVASVAAALDVLDPYRSAGPHGDPGPHSDPDPGGAGPHETASGDSAAPGLARASTFVTLLIGASLDDADVVDARLLSGLTSALATRR